jgi:aquaporin Z
LKNYLTEFIGTFFLVPTIGLTMVDGNELAPLAIGAALLALVYMGGHISGAHYNPAVTLAIFLRGRFEGGLVAPYMVSQVAGAFVATLAVSVVTGSTFAPAPSPDATTMAAFAGGPVSGGAFNPAVGTGPILAHVILATVVFRLQHDD